MATSLTLENDSSLAQGYLKVNGSTAATLTTSGITANLTGNVTGNADTATKLSTTTGSAPAYACRAWVNFDGTRDTTGAVSTANTNRFIRASGNVASVLRNGQGNYSINFTTPMVDANYSVSSCVGNSVVPPAAQIAYPYQPSSTSSLCNVIVSDNNTDTLQDSAMVCIQIFS